MTKAHLTRALSAAARLVLWLALVFASRAARADEIPPRTGHLIDTSRLLRRHDRDDLEEKLKKLKKELRVDVVMWIADTSEGEMEGLGRAAYEKWDVGSGVDAGLLFVLTRRGRAIIVEPKGKNYFYPWELKSVRTAEKPDAPIGDRAFAIEHELDLVLRKKTVHRRPRGTAHPKLGMVYLAGAVALAMLAIFLSFRDRREGALA